MEIEHKTYTPSIIELYYFRIATEDVNGKINVFSIDFENKTWKIDLKHKGHTQCITSLCELDTN